jgi:D-glycerate 3-kinase
LWPTTVLGSSAYAELHAALRTQLAERTRQLRMPEDNLDRLCAVYLPLAAWIDGRKTSGPIVVGVNGAQGSGKSTLCWFLELILSQGFGHRVAGFSIDDLYKSHAERVELARSVHPLLITRGVPGTHDVELGRSVIDSLLQADSDQVTLIPAFDKAADDRRPQSAWTAFEGPADIVLFEGWCVGARPLANSALVEPMNELEASEDADGSWRRYVNEQLAGDYAALFLRLDQLIMLKIPSMDSVYHWRSLQEEKLAATLDAGQPHRLMGAAALRRFIMHYERLTRAMLAEMPQRAEVTLFLDSDHHFNHIQLLN